MKFNAEIGYKEETSFGSIVPSPLADWFIDAMTKTISIRELFVLPLPEPEIGIHKCRTRYCQEYCYHEDNYCWYCYSIKYDLFYELSIWHRNARPITTDFDY